MTSLSSMPRDVEKPMPADASPALSRRNRRIEQRNALRASWGEAVADATSSSPTGGGGGLRARLKRKLEAARKLRPAVADTFRDDLQLDHRRFVLLDIDVPFVMWIKLAEGGFGVVYLVSGISPPIVIAGKHFSRIAMKVPKRSVRVSSSALCALCSVLCVCLCLSVCMYVQSTTTRMPRARRRARIHSTTQKDTL